MLNKLREIDDAYSKRIMNMYMGKEGSERQVHPLLDAALAAAGTYMGGTAYSQMDDHPAYKVSAHTSGVAKYAAPVVGVTLAGKALMDLTSSMSGQSGELPLN